MSHVGQISIVDDDDSVREAMLSLVRAEGFPAEMFPSAEEFLKCEDIGRTWCLIADMRMPGMSGLDLHNHLVAAGTAIPMILITAFPDDRDRARARAAGVICYLAKPCSEIELLDCIRSGLERSGRRAATST